MTTIASSLLDFLLSLFRDPDAAARYEEDARAALDEAGLHDVEPADVDALRPTFEDSSPMAYGRKNHCDDDDRPHHAPVRRDDDCDDKKDDHHYAPVRRDDDCDDDHRPQHDGGHGHSSPDVVAVTHVKYVENNYDIDVDIDARNSVWAGGDAIAIWGDDVVLATGGSVAAGDDVKDVDIDNSSTDVDVDVDIEDSFNTDNSTNSHNTDTNIADRGGRVEDNDTTVTVDDVTIVNDSFNGATIAGDDVDQSTDVDVKIEDSLNGNTLAGGDVTQTEVEIEDSLNGNNLAGGDVYDVEVEDSFNHETEVEVEDVEIGNIVTGDNSAGEDLEQESETEFEVDEALIVVVPDQELVAPN